MGLVPSALGVTHPGFLSLLRSSVCPSLAASASQFAHLGSFTLPQCSAHLEPAVLAVGLSCFGVLMSAPSHCQLGPSLSPQSFVCTGSSMAALNAAITDFALFLRALSRLDLFLPALDLLHLGFALLVHSFVRCGPASLMTNYCRAGPPLSLRQSCRTGSLALIAGVARAGLVFSLSVVNLAHLDLLLPPRSLACLDPTLSASGESHLDPSAPSQSLSHVAFPLSAPSFVKVDSLLPLRQFA